MKRKKLIISIALVVLISGGGTAAYLARASAAAKSKADDRSKVVTPEFVASELGLALKRDLAQNLDASGVLQAVKMATVRTKVAAEVRSLAVREGDTVQAGQVLAQLDTAELSQRQRSAEGALVAAEARAANAKTTRDMQKALLDQQYISLNAFDGADSNYRAANGDVASARAQLALTRQASADAVVRAPIGGIVAKRMVNEGERVSFDAPLLQIVDLRQLELQAWVAPQAVSLLQVGQTVDVRVEGFAQPIKGRLSRVLPAVDASTRQLGIVVQVANEAQKLKTGLNASANVSLAARNALTVPKAALTNNNGDTYVWQLLDNKVKRLRVIVGAQHDEAAMVELLDGVNVGATVLLGRYDNLKDGQTVKLVEKKTAASAVSSAVPNTAAASAPKL